MEVSIFFIFVVLLSPGSCEVLDYTAADRELGDPLSINSPIKISSLRVYSCSSTSSC